MFTEAEIICIFQQLKFHNPLMHLQVENGGEINLVFSFRFKFIYD